MIGTCGLPARSLRAVALTGAWMSMLTGFSPAIGQTSDADSSAAALQEIVVTARKRDESIMQAPVLVQAITSDQLEQAHITNIESLSTIAPGTFINYGFAFVGITTYLRGLGNSPQATFVDQTVSLSIDDFTSATGALYRSAIFDTSEVQVLKGPQSLFFGKSTAAGVIAIDSADPTSQWDAKATTSYEFKDAETEVNGYISGPLTDDLGIRLAGYHRTSEGYMTDPNPDAAYQRIPADDDNGGRLTLKYDNSDIGLRMRLKAAYTRDTGNYSLFSLNEFVCSPGVSHPFPSLPYDNCRISLSGSGPPAGLPYNPNIVFTPNPAQAAVWNEYSPDPLFGNGRPYTVSQTALGVFKAEYDVSQGLTLTSVSGVDSIEALDYGTEGSLVGPIDIGGDAMYHEFSEEVRLASDWKDRWYNFIVGGFHGHETSDIRLALSIRNYQTFSDNTVIIDSDDNSAFGQISLTPIDKWELDAGVRYTHVTRAYTSVDVQNDFGALIPGSQGEQIQNLPYDLTHYAEHDESPEATLSYKPTPDFMAFLSYKQGYKGPGNNSVLNTVPVVNAAALAAQPFVHGEKAKGAEGGVKVQLFDHQLALTATGYRYNYDDEQVSFATQNSTSSILANAASLRVQGVELGGDYHPNAIRGLALSAFMNYNDTHYLKFPNAACYEGQTAAQGCSAGVQDLSGRTVSMAPQWSGNLGGSYTWNLTDRYTASVNAMVQYSSSYFADTNLDPLGRVGSYAMLDAGIRVGKSDGSWELALLCRDCTNKLYIVNGTDGSAIPPAVIEDIGRPLQIVLQLTVKPNLL